MRDRDLVPLLIRLVGGLALSLPIPAGFLYSSKPHAATYLFIMMLVLVLIDLRLYWGGLHGLPFTLDIFTIWLVSLLVFCAMGTIYSIRTEKLLTETEHHGWLLPADDQTPPGACDRVGIPDDGVLLSVGDSAVIVTGSRKLTAVKVGNCPLLRMQYGPNGLVIDADVFSESGDLIARISDNEFHLVEGRYSYSERPDPHTLAVYDRRGKELLWVRYLNPKVIKIRGIFSCPNYQPPMVFDDAGIHAQNDKLHKLVGNCLGVDTTSSVPTFAFGFNDED